MWVDFAEIELANELEDDGADGGERAINPVIALSGLEQAVDGFKETVVLARLGLSGDAIDMRENHLRHCFHGLDLRANDVGGPLCEHGTHDIDLIALQNLAQLLLVKPSARRAPGGRLRDESIQVGASLRCEAVTIPQQFPAQALEAGVDLLFAAPSLFDGRVGVSNVMELVDGDPGLGQMVGHALDESLQHVYGMDSMASGSPSWAAKSVCKFIDRFGFLAFGGEQKAA